jgi:hypothetical protein
MTDVFIGKFLKVNKTKLIGRKKRVLHRLSSPEEFKRRIQ